LKFPIHALELAGTWLLVGAQDHAVDHVRAKPALVLILAQSPAIIEILGI
jgi:hypothetical protein